MLIKRYEALGKPAVGDVIGVDDFAYKKRNTYGTIIVDKKSHNPITLLDGRDGETSSSSELAQPEIYHFSPNFIS